MALERDVQRFILRLLKELDSPRSLGIKLLIEAGDWDLLPALRVDPLQYEPLYHGGIEKYRRDVLASDVLRKYVDLPTSIDTAEVARTTFLETERQCAETNLRLDRYLSFPVLETDLEVSFWNLAQRAKAWIRNTLGPLPDRLDGHFGPGATFESAQWVYRKQLVTYDKLRNPPTRTSGVSNDLVNHIAWETSLAGAWESCCTNRLIPISRGNRFATVPKDSTKDRGIAVEPGLNVFGQLAIGGEMKQRLKRRGLDLKKGQELHCRMAARASVTGEHATIDLSNASNTVSRSLVKLLLPDEWYDLLSELRSPLIRMKDSEGNKKWYRLEMFSSMGNGYTFELETLLFASLIHAVGGQIGVDSFVYGDDIIVPTQLSADVLAILRYTGFTPNPRKTFTQGIFRESCGGDYLLGHDVRPFYVEESPHVPSDWITIANSLWNWSIKWSMPELVAVRNSVLDNIPSDISRCRGPQALGDLVIHDLPERWSCVVRGWKRYFRVWRPVSKRVHLRTVKGSRVIQVSPLGGQRTVCTFKEIGVALAAATLGLPSDGLTPREGITGYRFGRVVFS